MFRQSRQGGAGLNGSHHDHHLWFACSAVGAERILPIQTEKTPNQELPKIAPPIFTIDSLYLYADCNK
jgi:hypothetical protein